MFWWWKRRSNQSKSLRHDSLLRGKRGRGEGTDRKWTEEAETATRTQRVGIISPLGPQPSELIRLLLGAHEGQPPGKQAADSQDVQETEQWRKAKPCTTSIYYAGAEQSLPLLISQCLVSTQRVHLLSSLFQAHSAHFDERALPMMTTRRTHTLKTLQEAPRSSQETTKNLIHNGYKYITEIGRNIQKSIYNK